MAPESPERGRERRGRRGRRTTNSALGGEEEEELDIDAFASSKSSDPFALDVEKVTSEVQSLRAELAQKVLEGLRGDAHLAARDLGVAVLWKEDGTEQLTNKSKTIIFPFQTLEAKEFFRTGQRTAGLH